MKMLPQQEKKRQRKKDKKKKVPKNIVEDTSVQKQDRRDDPALWESWDGGLVDY